MDPRVWLVAEGLFALGAVLMALGHSRRRADARARRPDWIKFAVYFGFIHVLLGLAALGRTATGIAFAALWILGAREAAAVARRIPSILAAVPALLLAGGFGHALLSPAGSWARSFAVLLLLVAVTDSYAQLCGRLWGRRHPFPSVSPGKTAEGLLGGIAAAAAVGWVVAFLMPELPDLERVGLAIATAAAGVAGDLVFSAVKRRARIKDFSGILPGHGGILDRFDSMALAAPVYFWTRACLHA